MMKADANETKTSIKLRTPCFGVRFKVAGLFGNLVIFNCCLKYSVLCTTCNLELTTSNYSYIHAESFT